MFKKIPDQQKDQNKTTLSTALAIMQNFVQKHKEPLCTVGFYVPAIAFLGYPLEKLAFAFQITRTSHSFGIFKAARIAFEKPLAGFGAVILYAVIKSLIKFPVNNSLKAKFESVNPGGAFNHQLAGFCAGVSAVYGASPFSVYKAWRLCDKSWAEFKHLEWKDLRKGVHATAARDGVNFGTCLPLIPLLTAHFNNQALAGAVAGVVGGFVSNPLAVIAQNQKVYGGTIIEQAKSLYKQNGIKRFYNGFFEVTMLRQAFAGTVAALAMNQADKICNPEGREKRSSQSFK